MAEKYLPLYRKYRPASFQSVVGQEVVVKTLLNAISHNRVAHAYLFCGPRGTGKTSIARIFAKTLNCLDLKDNTPCGKCAHCLDMNNTISMDVIEIDAASNRKVEDARNLLEKVQFTPVLGKNKIYIIDEVHMLTTEAFNTLLKTLEEPPENLVFILATTESHKVMETIVSRCQKFDFRRISVDDIKNRLKYVAENENIKIDDDAIEFIARKSAGGLRDALALLDQSTVLALENKSITKKDITTLLGSVDDEDLFKLAQLIANKNANEVINLLKTIVDKGNDPNQIIKELISYFRNLMLATVCKNTQEASQLLDISAENCEKILEQSKNFSTQELVQIIEELSTQERNIRNSTNPYLWLDVAIISAATRENIMAEKALLERIENLENAIGQGFTKTATPIKTAMPATQTPPVAPIVTPNPTIAATDAEQKKEIVQNTVENKVEKVEKAEEQPQTEEKPLQQEEKQSTSNVEVTPKPSSEITLVWDTFLGELQSNPALFALIKTHARPITLTSEKIELAFRNDIFIDKVSQKKTTIEEVAKRLCGKIPTMIFRKISDEDFKKKIASEEPKTEKATSIPKTQVVEITEEPSFQEELAEIKEVKIEEKTPTAAYYDLSEDVRQVMTVFSGKIIE